MVDGFINAENATIIAIINTCTHDSGCHNLQASDQLYVAF